METNIGIGVQPVTSRGVASIDNCDVGIRVREQRVGKRHPRGSGPDHEIVRFEFFVHHSVMIALAAHGAPIFALNRARLRAAAAAG